MKVDVEQAAKTLGVFRRTVGTYEDVTGQFALTWILVALLNLLTQAALFHNMFAFEPGPDKATGEFGIFNASLAIIGLLMVPALAWPVAFRLFFARAQSTSLDRLRASSGTITETFAWIWGACCLVVILIPLPLPSLPRFALELFTLMNVLLGLGALISGVVCTEAHQLRRWALLVISACAVRLVLGAWFTVYQPWTEAALAAYLVAGFITLTPALRPRNISVADRLMACASALDRSFLLFAGATLSVLLGIYLFTNADRIVALSWFNVRIGETNVPSAPLQHVLDIYQATGLLARALLWGTQPLLWMLYAERSKLNKTTPASLKFFWIYLGALLVGAFALGCLSQKDGAIDTLIPSASSFGPTFAAVMVPLGLLQGFAIFALASRRYPECFLIGACGIVYALVLALFGEPRLILPLMLGTSLAALMLVLFVGVVRFARKTP